MQQWEYLQLTFSHAQRLERGFQYPWRDSRGGEGIASDHWGNVDYATLLNQLGGEGWEVVGNWNQAIILKRPKQQWEYMEILIRGGSWLDNSGRKGTLPRMEGEVRNTWPFSVELCNAAGLQRWELAGVVGNDRVEGYRLFFKRRKE
jgi:hypothetical protein